MNCTYEGRCSDCSRLFDSCDGDEEYQDVEAKREDINIIDLWGNPKIGD